MKIAPGQIEKIEVKNWDSFLTRAQKVLLAVFFVDRDSCEGGCMASQNYRYDHFVHYQDNHGKYCTLKLTTKMISKFTNDTGFKSIVTKKLSPSCQ